MNIMTQTSLTAVVAVRMTPDLARQLKEAARLDDRTVSGFARRVLERALHHAALAAPTDSGPFCCPTSGENDRSHGDTDDVAA